MAGSLKKTTGIAGLAVARDPHHTLSALYGKIMRVLERMPENAAYRNYTVKIITQRIGVLKSNSSVKKLEDAMNCGQAEELIQQAENELSLARKMLVWKPWEPLMTPAPEKQWVWPPPKITPPKI